MDARHVDKLREDMTLRRKEAHLVIDKKLTEKETSLLAATSSIAARTVSAPIERIKILCVKLLNVFQNPNLKIPLQSCLVFIFVIIVEITFTWLKFCIKINEKKMKLYKHFVIEKLKVFCYNVANA